MKKDTLADSSNDTNFVISICNNVLQILQKSVDNTRGDVPMTAVLPSTTPESFSRGFIGKL